MGLSLWKFMIWLVAGIAACVVVLDHQSWKSFVVRWPVTSGLSVSSSSNRAENDGPVSTRSGDNLPDFCLGKGQLQCFLEENSLSTASMTLKVMQALNTMQSQFFTVWQGTWPDSIDWTAAVLGTHLSSALSSISVHFPQETNGRSSPYSHEENYISTYFTQLVTFYFGQNAFGLRTQAYDDMLWVVLSWLDAIKFVKMRSSQSDEVVSASVNHGRATSGWYGTQFVASYSHRARIFYDLASKGWDTDLCGGGMLWNPYLKPYKNAITNELFIAASIGMYLYFPGDDNSSPFTKTDDNFANLRPHDPRLLQSAIEGYRWLSKSNMTNEQGLYVDGFHISGDFELGVNTKCDERNEMVYTYNQGVILSGLRGLWEGTGDAQYLFDAHSLIHSVIKATGWHLHSDSTSPNGEWAGLGRGGILEEVCDSGGYCSQDAQTFKGIFFHHFSAFCAPLPTRASSPGITVAAKTETRDYHAKECQSYAKWVAHNAQAAYATRDSRHVFGMWWGDHRTNETQVPSPRIPLNASDYRNRGHLDHGSPAPYVLSEKALGDGGGNSGFMGDVNDRGRGRTVETQSGGLSVLLATSELYNTYEYLDK